MARARENFRNEKHTKADVDTIPWKRIACTEKLHIRLVCMCVYTSMSFCLEYEISFFNLHWPVRNQYEWPVNVINYHTKLNTHRIKIWFVCGLWIVDCGYHLTRLVAALHNFLIVCTRSMTVEQCGRFIQVSKRIRHDFFWPLCVLSFRTYAKVIYQKYYYSHYTFSWEEDWKRKIQYLHSECVCV